MTEIELYRQSVTSVIGGKSHRVAWQSTYLHGTVCKRTIRNGHEVARNRPVTCKICLAQEGWLSDIFITEPPFPLTQ